MIIMRRMWSRVIEIIEIFIVINNIIQVHFNFIPFLIKLNLSDLMRAGISK
jgi:hypothetical protein